MPWNEGETPGNGLLELLKLIDKEWGSVANLEGVEAVWRIPRSEGDGRETQYFVAYIREGHGYEVSTALYHFSDGLKKKHGGFSFVFQPRSAKDYHVPAGEAHRDKLLEKQQKGRAVCVYEHNGGTH